MARLWRAMSHLFGTRWAENYGREPSPVWAAEVDSLTDEQIAIGYQRLLRSGASHPPTLPEFLEFARRPSGARDTSTPQHNCAQFELAVNNWFVHRAMRFRFVGIDNAEGLGINDACRDPNHIRQPSRRPTLMALRARCLEESRIHTTLAAEGDPDATNERLVARLDAIAEEIYPQAVADLWLAANRQPVGPKYRECA